MSGPSPSLVSALNEVDDDNLDLGDNLVFFVLATGFAPCAIMVSIRSSPHMADPTHPSPYDKRSGVNDVNNDDVCT